jgi:PIN domain nuclease of toxin-antitoxin system
MRRLISTASSMAICESISPSIEGFLLDTNIALIAIAKPERLSCPARAAILRGANVLSAVVFWEVTLRAAKGKLDVGDPRAWWEEALSALTATSLPLRPEHIAELHKIPAFHTDPFDRALIAQAAAEALTLVTTDAEIRRYSSDRVRVVG